MNTFTYTNTSGNSITVESLYTNVCTICEMVNGATQLCEAVINDTHSDYECVGAMRILKAALKEILHHANTLDPDFRKQEGDPENRGAA